MDAQLETRFQPQDWPRLVHNYRHEGTEKRRRELLAGKRGDQWLASYRSDTKRGAPQGLRIWRPATEHPIPAAAVDSMGAVYLVRSMIVEGRESLRFPMLDKQGVWQVDVQLGAAEELTTPAGRFRGRPVTLVTTRIDPGAEAEAEEEGGGHFEGPFGIRGRIELWMEEQTGVPLVILGAMPVLGSDLQIDIRLEQFEGTPAEFVPLPAAPTR
jgi:hypothetical protein